MMIPTQAKLIGALVGALLLVLSGWVMRGWLADAEVSRLNAQHAETLKAVSDKAGEAEAKARQKETEWRDSVTRVDELRGDLDHAKSELERLRGAVGSGTQRVLVRAKCPAGGGGVPGAAGAAGVDHAAGRAELDPETARDLVGIAGDGDDAIRRLTALQRYVHEVCAVN